MRRPLRVGLGATLAALALGLSAGVVAALSGDRLPVKSVAEVVPQDVIAFARLEGVQGHWKALRETEAFRDLERSPLVRTVLGELERSGELEGFLGMLGERAERLGLPPGLDTYMKFVGHDLGFGLRLDRETGEPSMIMLYRIDTPALLKDLALSSPAALIRHFTEGYMGEVPSASYGGYDIFDLGEGRGAYALLRDIVVASNSRQTVERAIDVANAGGLGSLGRSKSYVEEIARLPEGTLLSAWVDVARLRDPAFLADMLPPPAIEAGLAALDAGIKPFPAIALSLGAPGSDLYKIALSSSRSAADLLVDTASPALASLASEAGAAYVEIADIRGACSAFAESPLWAKAKSSAWGQKAQAVLDDPSLLEREFGIPTELPPIFEGNSTRFERTLGGRLLTAALDLVFPGAMAISVDPPAEGAQPPIPAVTLAVKAPPLAQVAHAFAMAVASGAAALEPSQEVVIAQVGARTVLTFQDVRYAWDDTNGELVVEGVTPIASFARIGDTLLVSTDLERVSALAGAAERPAGISREGIPDGYWLLMRVDYARLGDMFEALTAIVGDELAELQSVFAGIGAKDAIVASYIKDGFTTFETLSWMTIDPSSPAMSWATKVPSAPFEAWSFLPADTVLNYAIRFEPQAMFDMLRGYAPPADVDAMLAEASQVLGVDIATELVPALGGELSLALAPQAAPEGAIAVPAVTLSWKLRDKALVANTLQSLLEQALPPPPPETDPEELAYMPRYVQQADGGVTFHVVEPPLGEREQTGGTVMPGFVVLGDTIVLSSSASALRTAAAKAGGYATSPSFLRAAAAVGADKGATSFTHLDLAGFARMLGGYAPFIAQAMPTPPPAGLYPPDYPEEGGDMEAWERAYEEYMRAYEEHRMVAAKENAARFQQGCDVAGQWLDFAASRSWSEGDTRVLGRQVLKLKIPN